MLRGTELTILDMTHGPIFYHILYTFVVRQRDWYIHMKKELHWTKQININQTPKKGETSNQHTCMLLDSHGTNCTELWHMFLLLRTRVPYYLQAILDVASSPLCSPFCDRGKSRFLNLLMDTILLSACERAPRTSSLDQERIQEGNWYRQLISMQENPDHL